MNHLRSIGLVAIGSITLFGMALVLNMGCTSAVQAVNTFEAPIIIGHVKDQRNSAETGCSINDQPYTVVDSDYVVKHNGQIAEIVIWHERIHVDQIRHFKGGCRALMDMYNSNENFRALLELQAYCESERIMATKYGIPNDAREEYRDNIRRVMFDRYGSNMRCPPLPVQTSNPQPP